MNWYLHALLLPICWGMSHPSILVTVPFQSGQLSLNRFPSLLQSKSYDKVLFHVHTAIFSPFLKFLYTHQCHLNWFLLFVAGFVTSGKFIVFLFFFSQVSSDLICFSSEEVSSDELKLSQIFIFHQMIVTHRHNTFLENKSLSNEQYFDLTESELMCSTNAWSL